MHTQQYTACVHMSRMARPFPEVPGTAPRLTGSTRQKQGAWLHQRHPWYMGKRWHLLQDAKPRGPACQRIHELSLRTLTLQHKCKVSRGS